VSNFLAKLLRKNFHWLAVGENPTQNWAKLFQFTPPKYFKVLFKSAKYLFLFFVFLRGMAHITRGCTKNTGIQKCLAITHHRIGLSWHTQVILTNPTTSFWSVTNPTTSFWSSSYRSVT